MQRILVIDDESALLEEVVDWLLLEDYEVYSAANGFEGIQLAFSKLPELVICDITMPEIDGYGVLFALRSNPSTAAVPFIFVTARASHEDIRQGIHMGADDYITKPFTHKELLQAIEGQREKKSLQDEILQNSVKQWQQAFEDEHEQRLLKARLVAMFSHDFRNPLAIISSSISMVRTYGDRLDEERRQKHFDRALSSVKQLTQMLDDMLMVSQLESGVLTYDPELVNVTEFIQEIINDFQIIHSDNHSLIFHSDVREAVMLDSRLLRQMISNLISNAIKYSPNGGRIWVKLQLEHPELILSIRDEGIGIPEADQARLFNAFQRASNVGKIMGTGLGLAIVKQAVNLHHGTIAFESQLGKGTHFIITL